MEVVVAIEGREAIPVRAIPFVTGWAMSPDLVAASLAHTDLLKRLQGISAYHVLPDGRFAPMLPKEWDGIEAELETLSDTLKATENVDWENYPEWRRRSIPLLPAGIFVWKDEFVEAFARAYSPLRLDLVDERPGDRELNFLPHIPTELLTTVGEGFERFAGMNDKGPMGPLLADQYDKTLAELAVPIREWVIQCLHGQLWDSLGPAGRRQLVEGYDVQHDPAAASESGYFFKLFCELDQLKDKLTEWEKVATPTATDKALQENNIRQLKEQIAALENKISSGLPTGQGNQAGVEFEGTASRTRQDALSFDIKRAREKLGEGATVYEVMQELKSYTGKDGSCIVEVGSDYVIWLAHNGTLQKSMAKSLGSRVYRKRKVQKD